MEIVISSGSVQEDADPSKLKELALHTLRSETVTEEAELSVVLVSSEKIQELNRQYRGEDSVTDVLSFPLSDEEGHLPQGQPMLLGEVIIAPEVARAQAPEYSHTYDDEISFLLVHGILHVLGYNHKKPEDARRMMDRERAILRSFQTALGKG